MNRRRFLQGLTLLGAGALVRPTWALPSGPRKLVLVHLFGGNDGLNTLVPWSDPDYRKARPTLALSRDQVLPIASGLGLHAALKPLLPLWERGKMAIFQGVGCSQPDRSHFVSSHLWHTAGGREGWLGRLADTQGWQTAQVDQESACEALWTPAQSPLCVHPGQPPLDQDPQWMQQALEGLYAGSSSRHLGQTYKQMNELKSKLARCQGEDWQGPPLRASLRTLLELWSMARVFHVTVGGFDTHGGQDKGHRQALTEVAQALAEFYTGLQAKGLENDTAILVYSEFGRRVQENASQGTDHGGAAPLFLLGGRVQGKLYGEHPSLTRLQDGDLKCHWDFRQIYASLLEDWLATDSTSILGGRFEKIPCWS